ncbi:MurR/RpiR family transcriptional regulator [Halomonas campisalis]|uniref:MurR/RpiR family transcriptional regulator n=2 Tax=Billgrantia campisalis TaxID=74661 RepID=A0ABS9PCJ4_9GAMM|nr:MurR/RpiR family transcriptional regulator [Halomonas campisalis]MCG6659174.1 MurR/RpiR family transcriptional regulator [Halomonas campisalis]MDR5863790.1 MurR/RpiR family transcriptional regulator [Halomonas campisalis]
MTPHIGQRISAQYADLSAQEQRVAAFILDHFDDLAVYSAADLSRLTGVSKSTVSRLFRRLGFESFQAVKRHARQLRSSGMPLVTDPDAVGGNGERFKRHLEREQDNLRRALTAIDPRTFEAIVHGLDASRRVVLVGFRNSYPLAMHFRQQLIQARADVNLAPQPNQSLAEDLVELGEADLVVLFGFRRRPRLFDALVNELAAMPCRLLLIGDATASGYAEQADWWLECPLDSISAFDSYASAMSLISLLANGLLHHRLAQGRARIDAVSELYQGMDELSP